MTLTTAKMAISSKATLCFKLSVICLFLTALPASSTLNSRYVRSFQQSVSRSEDILVSENELHHLLREKRDAEVTDTESERDDKNCKAQQLYFSEKRDELKNGSRLEETVSSK